VYIKYKNEERKRKKEERKEGKKECKYWEEKVESSRQETGR